MKNNLLKNLTTAKLTLFINIAIATTMMSVSHSYLPEDMGYPFAVSYLAVFLVSALGLALSSGRG